MTSEALKRVREQAEKGEVKAPKYEGESPFSEPEDEADEETD